MKRVYRGFPVFVWALLGLLAVAACLLSLGERDDHAEPSADSFGPSGTSALAELLRAHGYHVRVDHWPRPRLLPGEVAIAFHVVGPQAAVGSFGAPEVSAFEKFGEYLRSKVGQGVSAVELPVPRNFLADSRQLLSGEPTLVQPRGGQKALRLNMGAEPAETDLNVGGDDSDSDSPKTVEEESPSIGLWDVGVDSVLRAYQIGSGRLLVAAGGSFVTNRFIDRNDNARAALEIVGMVAPPGGAIVFTEASFGNAIPPSLMETIGTWANAGWQQLLFLGLVVILTLGKRFGIPEETRPVQRGTRELLDALADTYLRGKQTHAAMRSALDRTDTQLRAAVHLPRDATVADLNRKLPEELTRSLSELRAACHSTETVRPGDALELIRTARAQAEGFLAGQGRGREPRLSA